MKILDKYLAKGFLTYLGLSLVSFSALYLLVDVIQRSIKFGMTLTLVQYSLLQIPFIVSQMVPIACLIGSLFILNTLAKNSELIAMHACGIGLYRISTTLLVLSLLVGIANFFLTDIIVPPTIRKSRFLLQREIKGDKDFQIFKTERLW